MSLLHPSRSKALSVVALAAFVTAMMPAVLAAQDQAKPKAATVTGRVFEKDMRTAVEGAVIKIRHLGTGRIHNSQPSDIQGVYSLYELPAGRYAVGISHGGDDFNLNYTLVLRDGDSGTLSLCLDRGNRMALRDCTEKSFFQKAGAGIIVLGVVAGAAVYTIAQPEGEASPIR